MVRKQRKLMKKRVPADVVRTHRSGGGLDWLPPRRLRASEAQAFDVPPEPFLNHGALANVEVKTQK